jgi:tRNA(fMet)-specific endonuclease VapC
MTGYLLDTNHASRLFGDDQQLWARVRAAPDAEFSFCRPSVGELWFMVLNSARVEQNRAKLEGLLRRFRIWELNEAAAFEYGAIRVELRRKATPIPQIDTQIAAIARVNDLTVLSADSHFSKVQGLRVENWL